ncbi:MAG TPA: universal stress protein [Solirubrobacteraceae bacterium]|nr:universal stress protein [Solirubrobacteraceae bacterium]
MSTAVVAAVDATPRAYEVTRVAADLAERLDLRLVLVQVVEVGTPFPFGDAPEAERRLARARVEAAATLREVAVVAGIADRATLRVEHGHAAATIASVAREEDAQLVVAGSRGHGRLRSALLGSTTAELGVALDRPLVVVPHHAATALSAVADATVVASVGGAEGVVEQADALAAALGARLVLAHVATPLPVGTSMGTLAGPVPVRGEVERLEREARGALDRAAAAVRHARAVETAWRQGDPATALLELIDEQRAAVLVVGEAAPWQRLAGSARVPIVLVPAVVGQAASAAPVANARSASARTSEVNSRR